MYIFYFCELRLQSNGVDLPGLSCEKVDMRGGLSISTLR
jgi:hypothetical protein